MSPFKEKFFGMLDRYADRIQRWRLACYLTKSNPKHYKFEYTSNRKGLVLVEYSSVGTVVVDCFLRD